VSWSGARLFVFDLDGTLVDSATDIAAAVNETILRLAPAALPLPLERVRTYVGNGARRLVTRSLEAVGSAADVEAALPVFVECYRRRMLDNTRLYPGVAEALERLGDHALAVLTNKPGDLSREMLAGLRVAHRFFRIVGGGDGAAHKPDPAGLLELMGEVVAGPLETVMVGDSAIDVATGRRAGTLTVGVTYGFAPQELRAARPDLLLDDLRHLADLTHAHDTTPMLG
jgi:phosphoglycolate phosphatase